MINSRKLEDLHPRVEKKARLLIALCEKEGIDLLVTSTYRDYEAQEALYAQGRTAPGSMVTDARPGYSFHNHRVAFDVVPLKNGKPAWDDNVLWAKIGALAESIDLEWAWRWKSFQEKPHFQFTGGLKIKDFLAGKHLPTWE